MIISKWLKKYDAKNYRFVTYDDGTQNFVVDDGDALFPIDVKTAKEANCFGQHYKVRLVDVVVVKDEKISLLKAKCLARRDNLYNKYKQFVVRVKEAEEKTGINY